MSYQRITFVTVCLCLLAVSPGSWADEGDASDNGSDKPVAGETVKPGETLKAAAPPLIYVPPSRSAPRTRLGGATRGLERVPPGIEVLAPEGVGLTLESQPVLYWYLPEPTQLHIGLTVADETSLKPLLEVALASPKRAGVQRVRLADHGFTLEKGVEYQWFISIARDADRKDLDQITGGSIARIAPPAELTQKLAAASEAGRSYVLAEGGVWYDAIDALSRRIDATPDESQLRILRADLLEQVGLGKVAEAERASAAGKPREMKSGAVSLPVYSPPTPVRASYSRNLTGLGARGPATHESGIRLFALAPNHLGVSVREQPTLYWFLEQDSDVPVEFTLIDDGAAEPLIEITFPPPLRAGYHSVDLAKHRFRLATGTTYEWSAALLIGDRQIHPTISVGFIEHRAPDRDLDREIAKAGAGEAVAVYARRGLWYEAFDDVSRQIAAAPSDPTPRLQRAALLDQVGLTPVAEYARLAANGLR